MIHRQLCRGFEVGADAWKIDAAQCDAGNVDDGNFFPAFVGYVGNDVVAVPAGRQSQMLLNAARPHKNLPITMRAGVANDAS